ncbi:MAG: hypothetical protein L0287_02730 [Anaerolineae bacterium]|nr:hypothetical protein [Anaerolineae bacterium]
MKIRKFFLLLSTLCTLLFLGTRDDKAQAATGAGWSPDVRIPGYLDDTFTPFLLADPDRGLVHAFASQWVKDLNVKAIVYRQWSLRSGWTRPVDILLAPTGNAFPLGAYLDRLGMLHVIFSASAGDSGNAIYYSKAVAATAHLAAMWLPPVIVGENALGFSSVSNSAAIIGDNQNNIFIIYSGNKDGPGIYFMTSYDAGEYWSEPIPVFLTYDGGLVPNTLRLSIGPEDGKAHATWNIVKSPDLVDEALYYASYSISNSRWDAPLLLDRRIDNPEYWGPSYPTMIDNGKDIVVLYNGGNPYAGQYVGQGRPVMRASISSDGGLSWNGPTNPFPLLNGRSGEHALAVDGVGGVHGLFVMRIDQQVNDEYGSISGIWHSIYLNGIWNNPDRIVTTLSPHDVRAVIVQGNVLLAVWREDPGEGASGIWFSYAILDIPEQPSVSVPTVLTAIPTEQVPVLNSTPNTLSLVPEYTSRPESNDLNDPLPPRWGRYNPAFPVVVGLLPVIFVVIGLFFAFRFLNNRR